MLSQGSASSFEHLFCAGPSVNRSPHLSPLTRWGRAGLTHFSAEACDVECMLSACMVSGFPLFPTALATVAQTHIPPPAGTSSR